MILTVTMNPSIDISYPLGQLHLDQVNRTQTVLKTAGGKGLNVARVAHLLGASVLATGVVGGFHGDYLKKKLDEDKIPHDFTSIKEETRNSIAILHDGQQTELLEAGPMISAAEQDAFLTKFDLLLEKTAVLTLSGSLARGLATDFYVELMNRAAKKQVKVLLDTSGSSLRGSLMANIKPYLIKPNDDEIFELTGERLDLNDIEKVKSILNETLFDGVEWVVISLGSQGALIKYQTAFYRVEIPNIEVVNPVGSGDATLAGFAYGLNQGFDEEQIMTTGMVAGMLNAQESKTGFINKENFDWLQGKISIKKI